MNTQSAKLLKTVFQEAIDSCSPDKLLLPLIRTDKTEARIAGHSLGTGPVHVFGSGKAAVSMAIALRQALKERIAGGLIVSPEESPALPSPLRHITGGHPIPTSKSQRAGEEMMREMAALKPTDRFVYLLSGGSSALIEVPEPPISVRDIAHATKLLLNAGLPIKETNRIRVHLSRLKGGGLGSLVSAKGIVLAMSDVMGDALSVIGSGPLWPVERDYRMCAELLRQRGLWQEFPAAVRENLTHPANGLPREFRRFQHEIVANNNTLLLAVQTALEKRNYPASIVTDRLEGEAAVVGRQIVDFAKLTAETMKSKEKLALLFSGETTVTVKGDGTGGRCQELALAALIELKGNPTVTLLAAGSDGRDGPTDAAGAIADQQVWKNARKLGLSPERFLAKNDSYHFFHTTGGLIQTGTTGINLLDIVIVLIHPSPETAD